MPEDQFDQDLDQDQAPGQVDQDQGAEVSMGSPSSDENSVSDSSSNMSCSSGDWYMSEVREKQLRWEEEVNRRMIIIWQRPEFTIVNREVVENDPDDFGFLPNHTVVRLTLRNGDIITGVESQVLEWMSSRIRAKAVSFLLMAAGGRYRINFQRCNRMPRSEGPVQVSDF